MLQGVKVIPAFLWSEGYHSDINTHFPSVRSIHAAPFHGMTDLLLIAEKSPTYRLLCRGGDEEGSHLSSNYCLSGKKMAREGWRIAGKHVSF